MTFRSENAAGRANPKVNPHAASLRAATDAAVLVELEVADYAHAELAGALGMSKSTVRHALVRLRAARKVRIAGYEIAGRGWTRLYGLGDQPDAEKPRPQSKKQIDRRYAAKHRARLRAVRSKAEPMQIFYNQLIARTA